MFTGIVEAVGSVLSLERRGDGARLAVDAPFGGELAVGESVAVDGCCLTALAMTRKRTRTGTTGTTGTGTTGTGTTGTGTTGTGGALEADLSPETLARTALGFLRQGDRVNLERAMRPDGRLSGHLVQGHVDDVARLVSSVAEGGTDGGGGGGVRQRWSLPEDLATLVAPKGSITLAGVSLTIAALGPGWFEVALIPATLAATNLGERHPGDRANVELDIVGKHVVRALALAGSLSLPRAAAERLGLEGAAAERLGLGDAAGEGSAPVRRVSTGAPWESLVGYCRAVRVGRRIVVSGTAPVEPDGSTHAPGDAEKQARRCLEIAMRAVRELGGTEAVVVRTRMFVTDVSRWAEFGRAHAEVFGSAPPATTMVEVSRLISPDMLIEIEVDAEVP